MGLQHTLFAAALLCASVPVSAAFTLDFEGVGNGATINGFYNGGTDSAGNMGFNYGAQFDTNALGLIDADSPGGTGNFANEPSPNTAMFFFGTSRSAVLNYETGFTGGFAFYYSSRADATINVYDGLNGTGNVVGSLSVRNQAGAGGCQGDPNGQFCNWTLASVSFSGLAKSIDFGGTQNQIAYDNITFGIDVAPPVTTPPITPPPGDSPPITPPIIPPIIPPINGGSITPPSGGDASVAAIPEPSTYALMAVGLLTVGIAARRRKRA